MGYKTRSWDPTQDIGPKLWVTKLGHGTLHKK